MPTQQAITIAGDSMLKDVKQWHVQNAIPGHKIYVKCFPGATTTDMRDYFKPSMRHDPDMQVLPAQILLKHPSKSPMISSILPHHSKEKTTTS